MDQPEIELFLMENYSWADELSFPPKTFDKHNGFFSFLSLFLCRRRRCSAFIFFFLFSCYCCYCIEYLLYIELMYRLRCVWVSICRLLLKMYAFWKAIIAITGITLGNKQTCTRWNLAVALLPSIDEIDFSTQNQPVEIWFMTKPIAQIACCQFNIFANTSQQWAIQYGKSI